MSESEPELLAVPAHGAAGRWNTVSRHVVVGALLVAAVTASAACGGQVRDVPVVGSGTGTGTVRLSFPDSEEAPSLRVQISDTPEERSRGLMGVESLPADEGMAFLYDAPSTGRYWMKDTLIPLSIAFWDESGRIVGSADMRPCGDRDPGPTYGAPSPYIGAVEANLGWFDRHGVEIGDGVEMEGCCSP